jgi:hypothetical protein
MPSNERTSDLSHTSNVLTARAQDILEQYEAVRKELGETIAERDNLRQKMERLWTQFRELEQVLADPEQGTAAIVYYRLRAVWSICQQQLTTLARQSVDRLIVPDRQRYEQKIAIALQTKRQAMEERKSQIQAERASINATVMRLEEELKKNTGFHHTIARRGIERSLQTVRERLIPYDARIKELDKQIESLDQEPLPPYPGLPINMRRDINLLLIALAQQNYLLFRADNVADHALTAHRKALKEVYFGTPADCQKLDRCIREALVTFRSRSADSASVRRRASDLRLQARYLSEEHTVPIPETLNFIHETRISDQKRGFDSDFDQPVPVNVLALNYWNLQDVLMS